ncbi:hypothetical protein IV417_11635 [Alphaproteobacteria bacterium KMM 3653]|uniref:Uncharacterized protein n=1 Tax=Harenicola maris TaxID=2841044 RepID=A0AAP2CP73_9RHOB|nr:hypothetical protein [Harenicola maris]
MKRFILATALAALPAFAQAATPSGGLGALSLSPDGATLLAAGDNRVLYTIDPDSFEVTDRMWMPAMPVWMDHSADGSLVYVLDTDDVLTAHDATDMSRKWEIDRVRTMDFNAQAGRFVTVKSSSKASDVVLIDAANGAQIGSWTVPDLSVQHVGLTDDGASAVMITRSAKDENETKEKPGDDLSGVAKETFRKQHDGNASVLIRMDMATGAVETAPTWYTGSFFDDIRTVGDKTYFLKSGSDPMVMSADFSVELLDMQGINGDMLVINPAGDAFIGGDNADLSTMPLDGGAPVTFDQDKLPGWFEDMMTVEFHPDGRLIGVTDGWRVIVVDPAKNAKSAHPVF